MQFKLSILFPRIAIPALAALFACIPVYMAYRPGLPIWRAGGIIAAWVGCGMLLVSLVLMLRAVRLVQWLGGLDRMFRWHHYCGVAGYLLVMLHPLLLASDAFRQSPQRAWALLWPATAEWGMLVGWAGLVTLMCGMVTTVNAVLPYRMWRSLHGVLGLGVLLGFVHILLLGATTGALLGAALALALLVWRLVGADAGATAQPYLVSAVKHISDGVVEITLKPLAKPLSVLPGQFVFVAFFNGPHYRGCGEFHPFTVSVTGPATELGIAVKSLGDCTRVIQSLEVGVTARVHGPFGDFLEHRPAVPQLWLAGGIGITPFLAELRQRKLTQPTHLIYFSQSAVQAAFLDELKVLARASRFLEVDAKATGPTIPDLAPLLPDGASLARCECYICGPPAFMDACLRILVQRGVPSQKIHVERFNF